VAHAKLLTIGSLLRGLLGTMLLLLAAALAVPTVPAIGQLADARRVAAITRAGEGVFAALQYLRPERGAVQAALTAPAPAPAEEALLAGQPSPLPLTDWLRLSNAALDSAIEVPSAAVAEAHELTLPTGAAGWRPDPQRAGAGSARSAPNHGLQAPYGPSR
jgi:hypothetical protein